ncbi:thermonuclease family protein, partial [Candidatus Saccharibacteria bacterium]|nr:thermonuclease family protein [Candidatus Saccharibacteria bacterium]
DLSDPVYSQVEAVKPTETTDINFGIIFPGKVVNVVDGDTVDVEVRRVVRIRMLDCWAPESRTRDLAEKKEGLKAKDALQKVLYGRDVIVQVPIESDARFGEAMSMSRVLGRVIDRHTKVDYSEYMVKNGYASKTKAEELEALEHD